MMSWPYSPRIRMRPLGPGAPIRRLGSPRLSFAGGQSDRSGTCPSRVWITVIPASRTAARTFCSGGTTACRWLTSLPSVSPNPPGSTKSRCMSMITSAVVAGSNVNGVRLCRNGVHSESSQVVASMTDADVGHAAEHPALHGHHVQRGGVVAGVGGAGAVGQDQALVAAVVRLAHGRVHAHVGGDPGQHDVGDAVGAQHQVEVGGVERALAGLVDRRPRRGSGRPPGRSPSPARRGPGSARTAPPRRSRRRSGPSASACSAGRSDRSGEWPSRVWITNMPVDAGVGEHRRGRRAARRG